MVDLAAPVIEAECDDERIHEILAETRTIALVGASGNWKRPSFFVMKYLQDQGYRVIPVNPTMAGQTINGETVYASLADIPEPVDMVDMFRAAKECEELTRAAIEIGAKGIWMQIGVVNPAAIRLAKQAGLWAIMDRCPKIEHSRLSGALGLGGFYSGTVSAMRQRIAPPRRAAGNPGFTTSKRQETLAVHAGAPPDPAHGARSMPIYQTSAYVFDDTDHAASLFNLQVPGNVYGRLSNPTTAALEQKIAALEGGIGAACCASGHAAQLLALTPIMAPGRKIVAATRLYGGTITQFTKTFARFGWLAELVDMDDLDQVRAAAQCEQTACIFAESLTNPGGSVQDIAALAEIAQENGIPLIIDNTVATPILCRPFEHGADIVVHSTTKFLSGHGNAMGGAVVDSGRFDWFRGRDYPALAQPDEAYHGITFAETFGPQGYITYCHASALRDLGATMAPMNAYLTLIGLETLALRMPRHVENAERVAKFLDGHDRVESVSYAGLPTSPYYSLARRYMPGGAGSIFTFALQGGYEAGRRAVEACRLFSHLANIGDTRSLIIHPASTTHRQLSEEQRAAAGLGEGVLRLSVGIEHVDDLVADLAGAIR